MRSYFRSKQCTHPFETLAVYDTHSSESDGRDFIAVTYNLYCTACRERLELTHVELIGGVKAFLERGPVEGLREPYASAVDTARNRP